MPPKTKAPAAPKVVKASASRMTLAETMSALEKAGSAQTRKTYARHGAREPMYGVSFATLKTLLKRIGVDHELARALWDTGNLDARNLAVKVVDPARMSPADLDRCSAHSRPVERGKPCRVPCDDGAGRARGPARAAPSPSALIAGGRPRSR